MAASGSFLILFIIAYFLHSVHNGQCTKLNNSLLHWAAGPKLLYHTPVECYRKEWYIFFCTQSCFLVTGHGNECILQGGSALEERFLLR